MTPFQQTDPSGLKLGERLTLTCAVTKGDLPLSFSWTVDGRPLVSSGGSLKTVQIDPYTNLLSVDSLQPAHSGNYTCSVDNLAITATTPTASTRQRQSQLVLIQGIPFNPNEFGLCLWIIAKKIVSHCALESFCRHEIFSVDCTTLPEMQHSADKCLSCFYSRRTRHRT